MERSCMLKVHSFSLYSVEKTTRIEEEKHYVRRGLTLILFQFSPVVSLILVPLNKYKTWYV